MRKYILLFVFLALVNVYSQEINITSHPVSVNQCVGEPVSISVSAEASIDIKLNFQWFKDGEKLNGENTPILNFPALQHLQSGVYFCRISLDNNEYYVDSHPASIYALRPTTIIREPVDINTNKNDGTVILDFDAHVNGINLENAINQGELVKIQWFRIIDDLIVLLENNIVYDGVNTNKLSINLNTLPDVTYYYANIEGKCGSLNTRIVQVIKNTNVKIEIEDLEACEGTIQSLKANIFNLQNIKLEFQWYKNGEPIYHKENLKGIFSDELIFNPIEVDDNGRYKLEARIKGTQNKITSNEVSVVVGSAPKIVCFRIDTLIAEPQYNIAHPTHSYKGVSWLSIYYEVKEFPTKFEIYKNGDLVSTQYSDTSVFSLNDIFYLNYFWKTKDSSYYWVIAENACGIVYSDTISLYAQNKCDPFNQFVDVCRDDKFELNIKYKYDEPVNPDDQLRTIWHFHHYAVVPDVNDVFLALKNKYIVKNPLIARYYSDNYYQYTSSSSIVNLDVVYEAKHSNFYDSAEKIDEFCCWYMTFRLIPIITKQSLDKHIIGGQLDTLFYVYFENEHDKKIIVDLYFMSSLGQEPILIDKSEPDFGRWYRYIKESNFTDAGYYFALARHENGCKPISTDTVKVTIVPKGLVSGVDDENLNTGFYISPNPTSDLLTISLSDDLVENQSVKIYDLLGIEVGEMAPVLYASGGSMRIDVSVLPAGLYFVRIGSRVESFVKI
ncbi:MAG: T9SS type A sorting domain-containing protein [Candidatus Kapabacteria bacterium]|nr:T9SS type A sorting domain-containing protein [Candidatus Kapabacteria bacterium]